VERGRFHGSNKEVRGDDQGPETNEGGCFTDGAKKPWTVRRLVNKV